jgi:hypothetical protein
VAGGHVKARLDQAQGLATQMQLGWTTWQVLAHFVLDWRGHVPGELDDVAEPA